MLLAKKYEFIEKIGQGAFGIVYKARNIRTNEPVVIKVEPATVKTEISPLKHETTILNLLYSESCRNIPPTYWYGVFDTNENNAPITYRALVMPFYDQPLTQYIFSGGGDEETVATIPRSYFNIMRSAIRILNQIHDKYVIHRDLKPANWMLRNNEMVLIDFGLAGFYVDSNETHIQPPEIPRDHIIGTPKYISWNIHCGCEPSRRDDLISVIYMGLFMLGRGELWNMRPVVVNSASSSPTGLELEKTHVMYPVNLWFKEQKTKEKIMEMARPWPELATFAESVYGLGFKERPAYAEYSSLFRCV